MKIILIHGFKATSQSHFFPWLRNELHARGHEVIVPDLPNPEEPDPEVWTKFLVDEMSALDEDTIIVGHSLCGAAALRFLEGAEARATPKALILIATPWMIRDEKFRGFFLSELDFDVLMWKASRFVVMHAKDDPTIPFDHALKYQKVLHANLIEVPGAGHFRGTEYPAVLGAIEIVIGEKLVYEPGLSLENELAGMH